MHAHGRCCQASRLGKHIACTWGMLQDYHAGKHKCCKAHAATHICCKAHAGRHMCCKAHVHACCIRNAHVLQPAWLWYKGLVTQMNALCAFTYVSTGVSYTSIGHRNQKCLRIPSSFAQTADHNYVRIMSNTYTRMTDVCQNYVKLLTHF